jgi:hypothetical protein
LKLLPRPRSAGRTLPTSAATYAEWHTLPSSIRRAGRLDGNQRPTSALYAHEDDEDDDAEEADGDEQDGVGSEDGAMRHYGNGPGCPISDPSEPTLGAPERFSGEWRSNMGSLEDGEPEAWNQPSMTDGMVPANDQVPA